MKNVLSLTLNPSIDHILSIATVTLFEKNILPESHVFYGGKGINVAFTLGKLGVPTTATGLIGDHDLNGFVTKLSSVNVHIHFTVVNGRTRSAYKLIETSSNRDTEFNQQGAPIRINDKERLIHNIELLLKSHSWIALCGSIPPGLSPDIYASLIRISKEAGVLTCLDTSGVGLKHAIQALPNVLRINRFELGEILSRPISNQSEIIHAIKALHHSGISKVIVSMGSEGTLAFDGKKFLQVHIPKVEVVGLTGAGDTMTAGLIASLSKGKSFSESVRFSSALATASTLYMKPGDFDKSLFKQILKKTTIQEISN
jgi:1-phosphofructokinase